MKEFNLSPAVNYKAKYGFKDYRHNWYFKTKEGSFWLGYNHNAEEQKKARHSIVLEYNPNKLQDNELLNKVLKKFYDKGMNFEVISADVAVDLYGVDMELDVYWDKLSKKNYKEFRKGGSTTIYMGTGANRVKVYNKAKEQGLKDDMKWTRYEVSMSVKTPVFELIEFEYKVNLPEIYVIKQFEYDFNLSKTDWCLLQGVVNGCYSIDQMGRGKREKIRTALDKQSSFVPDKSELSRTLRDYVYNSLNKIKSPKKRKV